MTPAILNVDALDLQPWGYGVSIPGAGHASDRYTSEADLEFSAVSTRLSPGVYEYPDTGRFGLLAEMPSAADGKPRELRLMGRAGESIEYWQGE
jgi:hypothetical protein